MSALRRFIANLARLGALRRRGLAGLLEDYGGKVEGQGAVKHRAGGKTEFNLDGAPVEKQ